MTEPFISSVAVDRVGTHDHVRVFLRGQLAGTLVMSPGDGSRLRAILLECRDDASERPTPSPPPSLLDLMREKKQALDIEDVPWFVKDFLVLYLAAKQLVEREPDRRGNVPPSDFDFLELQIKRLEPAFRQCEAVRAATKNRSDR